MPIAEEMIHRLRSDTGAYEDAVRKEGAVWGRMFSDEKMQKIQAEDQAAVRRLRARRHWSGLLRVARSLNLQFEHGLSLACGAGRAEREMIARGVCKTFHGVDVSEKAIADARAEAAAKRLPISYDVGDLNTLTLEPDAYDLVVTQNCLHHVLELEHLAEQMWRCLRPGGRLWIHDFVGETQFQWSDARLEMADRIWAVLPERYRRSRRDGRAAPRLERRPIGKLASPFEAIRSAEILPILGQWFEVEFENEFDSVMFLLSPFGTLANYVETEDGPAIYELLLFIDRLLLEHKILPPLGGQYLFRRRERPEAASHATVI